MSSGSAFGRITGGVQGTSHNLSNPIAPTFVDPVAKVQDMRRMKRKFVGPMGSTQPGWLAGLGDFSRESAPGGPAILS